MAVPVKSLNLNLPIERETSQNQINSGRCGSGDNQIKSNKTSPRFNKVVSNGLQNALNNIRENKQSSLNNTSQEFLSVRKSSDRLRSPHVEERKTLHDQTDQIQKAAK